MSNTQFTGPLIAGPIQYTTGTTLGQNVANVGYCEMVQSAAITQTGSTTALQTAITIPAGSQIIAIDLVESTQWATANLSVGTTVSANELVSATAVGSAYRVAFNPTSAAQGALWINVGTTDISIWVLSSTGTGGVGVITVRYIQQLGVTTT